MSFGSPLWLLVLLVIPALIGLAAASRRRALRYAVRFPAAATLGQAADASPAWRSRVPAALLLAAVAMLALALAQPRQSYSASVGEASLMLVTDHSGSMSANDVQPTRLAAAQQAADSFIDRVPNSVRVGAVAFGTSPDASQPPTSDKRVAKQVIDNQVAGGSTATGDALTLALQLLHFSDARHPPSAIVLLSDGAANAGIDVVGVAAQAGRQHIPVYTVALGTPDGVLANPDPLGAPVSVPPDPQLLAQISAASGGRSFQAGSSDELNSIYQHLAARLGTVSRRREVTVWFALAGLMLLLGAAGLALRRSPRLP